MIVLKAKRETLIRNAVLKNVKQGITEMKNLNVLRPEKIIRLRIKLFPVHKVKRETLIRNAV